MERLQDQNAAKCLRLLESFVHEASASGESKESATQALGHLEQIVEQLSAVSSLGPDCNQKVCDQRPRVSGTIPPKKPFRKVG